MFLDAVFFQTDLVIDPNPKINDINYGSQNKSSKWDELWDTTSPLLFQPALKTIHPAPP